MTAGCLLISHISLLQAAQKQQSINYSEGLGSPIITTNTDTMEQGSWGASERMEYWRSAPLSDATLLQYPLTESFTGGFVNYLSANYGLTDDLTIGTNIPYFYSTSYRASDGEENPRAIHLGNVSGMGDVSFFSVWRFINNSESVYALALLSGINIPTGKHSVMTKQAFLFSAGDQPGGGAWGGFGGLVLSKKVHKKLEFSTNLVYSIAGKGAQQTTIGSLFDFNLASVYEMYRNNQKKINYDLIFELNTEHVAKNKAYGISDDFSGGTTVFGSIGARANWRSNTSFYAALNLPVIEYYYGVQPKTHFGLIAGVDVSLG